MSRCTAQSKRSGRRCQKWAIRGKTTCLMHGGASKGPKTKEGKKHSKQAAYRHGAYTKEAKSFYREALDLISRSKKNIHSIQ